MQALSLASSQGARAWMSSRNFVPPPQSSSSPLPQHLLLSLAHTKAEAKPLSRAPHPSSPAHFSAVPFYSSCTWRGRAAGTFRVGVRSRCRGEPILPDGGDSHAVTSPLSSAPQMTNSCGLQFGASLFIFSSPTCAAHVAARQSDLCPDLFPFLRGTGNSITLRAKM